MAKNNIRLTTDKVIELLGINDKDISGLKKIKLQRLIDKIYSASSPNISPDIVMATLMDIYSSDPELTALDDVYIFMVRGLPKYEYKYTFFPKKLVEYGVFTHVDAYVVKEGEDFKVHIKNGTTELEHTSNPFASNGKTIGAYARGVRPDGTVVIATATRAELDEAAKASKVRNRGASTIWDVWFDEVAKKVPLKRLVKMVPIPEALSNAINTDNTNYATVNEVAEAEKSDDAVEAFKELNQELKQKHLISMILAHYNYEYELKKGYIKISKDVIDKELAEKLGLAELEKYPGFYIGKNQEIEFDLPEKNKDQEDDKTEETEEKIEEIQVIYEN